MNRGRQIIGSGLLLLFAISGCAGAVPGLRIDKGYPDFRKAREIMGEQQPMRLSVWQRTGYAIAEESNEVFVLDLEADLILKRIPV